MKPSVHVLKPFYLIAVVLLVMIARGLPLPILIPLLVFILAVPLIRELRPKTDLDERQIALSHWSSHIALYVLIGLLLFVMLHTYVADGKNPDPEWYMLLIIPLVVKLIINLFQNYDKRRTAQLIGYFFTTIWLLFAILSHGFTLESGMEFLPFIPVYFVCWAAGKWPRPAGVGFIVLSLFMLYFFGGWLRFEIYIRLIMYTLIPLPLLISGVILMFYKAEEES